jgi:simple sugar transport system ATP-binding protein
VRSGEIVGVAGVAGNGQNELVQALVGLRAPDGGRVEICGRDVTQADVAAHRVAGLAYIPEDRAAVGSALDASAADNLAMGFHRAPPLASGLFINPSAFAQRARALISRFSIRIASERMNVGKLSGGNLQKIVIARELSHEAPALVAEQPTRGLDVGATEYIHERLLAERDSGRAVLLVTAELSEALALSDRVLVMFEGRILAELPQERADEQSVGMLMAGRGMEAP